MLLARTMELRPMGVWVWMGVVWGLGEGGVRPVGGGGGSFNTNTNMKTSDFFGWGCWGEWVGGFEFEDGELGSGGCDGGPHISIPDTYIHVHTHACTKPHMPKHIHTHSSLPESTVPTSSATNSANSCHPVMPMR